MSDYHPTVKKIKDFLDEHNCAYTCFEHEPVRTSEEAAAIRPEYTISQGAKALIIKVKDREKNKSFAQVVVPGDVKFNPKKVRHTLEATDIRFATPEEVGELTEGIVPGGVPPFGNLFNLPVIAERTLFDNKEIIFNAGDRRFSIAMLSKDYVKAVQPDVVSIV